MPTAQSYYEYEGWSGPHRYSSTICGSSYGYGLEVFPVSGLSVGAEALVCVETGDDADFYPVFSSDGSYGPYGAYVKYALADTGVSVTV